MEPDQYIANILLSKASVEIVGESLKVSNVEDVSSNRKHFMKLRKRAYFSRVTRKGKALASSLLVG